jgi:hypothetical protein
MCQGVLSLRNPLFQINYSGNEMNAGCPEEFIDPRREKDS